MTEQVIADAPSEGVMFLTDDSLFTQAIHLDADRLSTVIDDPTSAHSYSLRHGLSLKPLPTNSQPFNRGGYVWRFVSGRGESGHWAWRFSVDGHLYTRRALLPILRRLNYANPNSLEGFVNEYIKNTRPDLFNTLLFDEHSSLVGFILNKVQTYNGNRSLDVAPTYLNEKFLAGFRLGYHYLQPATSFQPTLTAIELINIVTGDREFLRIDP
ncbi:MAG: hypothetical protein EOO39_01025 [Cytophagaceae bacterium]|nr:MAG: hypothetical protein EOO39_01025 [Cytophagaceae bacterium]